MNIFIAFIAYYDKILTAFFSRMGSIIFQDMAGVRGGRPILFFFLLFFNLCSLYICCTSYIRFLSAKFGGYVKNNLYTEFCLFVCFTLTPELFPS